MFEQLLERAVEIFKKVVLKPGSKGGIGYYDVAGKWHYGVKKEFIGELDWEYVDGKFKTKSYKEMKDEYGDDMDEVTYKKMYKKSYSEFWKHKDSIKHTIDSGGVPDKLPEKPKKAKLSDVDKVDTIKQMAKESWDSKGGKFTFPEYFEMKKEFEDKYDNEFTLDDYKKTAYKTAYSVHYKDKSKPNPLKKKKDDSKKDLDDDKHEETAKKPTLKDKTEAKTAGDIPKYVDIDTEYSSAKTLYDEISTSAIKDDGKKLKSGISDYTTTDVQFNELSGMPKDNVGKVVMWQNKNEEGTAEYIIGTIKGYDSLKGEYEIAGGTKGTFTKYRPAEAILVPVKRNKKLNPEYKEELKAKVVELKSLSHEDTLTHIKEKFKNMSPEEKVSGITVIKDGSLIEDLGVKIRRDPISDETVVEFKLRDESLKSSFKNSMNSFKVSDEQVKWKSKDGVEYSAKMYKKHCKTDDGIEIEYFDEGFDSTLDTGYALKDTIRMKVKKGLSEQEAYGKVTKFLEDNELGGIVKTSTSEDIDKKKYMSLLNIVSPKKADKISNDGVDNYSISEIKNKLKVDAKYIYGEDWESKIKMIETGDGHQSFVIEGAHEKYKEVGFRYVWQGVGHEESVVSIMGEGALSSIERHKRGLLTSGASCHSDYSTGGADYVFTRMSVESSSKSSLSGYGSGSFQVIYKSNIMDRTDWFGYKEDSYGETNPLKVKGDYKGRKNGIEHIQDINKSYSSGNEVMFKKSIASQYVDKVATAGFDDAKNLYKTYKKRYGTTKMLDGRDITEVIGIKSGKQQNPISMTLAEYVDFHKESLDS